jgi:uncharacterized membrane protein (Fun14 family)
MPVADTITQDVKAHGSRLMAVLSTNMPSATGFAMGFLTGFKSG